jgi:hypothetical protein
MEEDAYNLKITPTKYESLLKCLVHMYENSQNRIERKTTQNCQNHKNDLIAVYKQQMRTHLSRLPNFV